MLLSVNCWTIVQIRDMLSIRRDALPASDPTTTSHSLNFSTQTPSITITTTTTSPKVDMIHALFFVNFIYTGSLHFLDNQDIFNNVCSSTRGILLIVNRSSRVIYKYETLPSKLLTLYNISQLKCFYDIV